MLLNHLKTLTRSLLFLFDLEFLPASPTLIVEFEYALDIAWLRHFHLFIIINNYNHIARPFINIICNFP